MTNDEFTWSLEHEPDLVIESECLSGFPTGDSVADVYRATRRNEGSCIVKFLSDTASQAAIRQFELEEDLLRLWSNCKGEAGPFVVPFHYSLSHALPAARPDGQRTYGNGYVMDSMAETLQDWLDKKRPLPIDKATGWMRSVSQSLHALHRPDGAGSAYVHRDIKPANLFLNKGVVHLGDFGSAAEIVPVHQLNNGDSRPEASLPSGTPGYRAPEQLGNERCSPATDVYGAGSTLFALLTGRPPYPRNPKQFDSLVEKIAAADQQLADNLPADCVRVHREDVPPELAAIIAKCLAKAPGDRYSTCAELADDLKVFCRGGWPSVYQPSLAERSRKLATHPRVISSVSLIAVTLLSLLAWWMSVRKESAQRELGISQAQTKEAVRERSAAVEQANTAKQAARQQEVLRHLAAGDDLVDSGAILSALPHFFQAKQIPGQDDRASRVHTARIGSMIHHAPKLVDCRSYTSVNSLAWDSFSKKFLVAGDKVELWGIGDNLVERPWLKRHPVVVDSFYDAALGDEGRQLCVVNQLHQVVEIWDREADVVHELPTTVRGRTRLAVSPDGLTIATSEAAGPVQFWDTTSGKKIGEVPEHDDTIKVLEFSPDGRWLVTGFGGRRDTTAGARLWDSRSGQPATDWLPHSDDVLVVAFSRDGKSLATGDWLGEVKIWDVESGQLVGEPMSHDGRIHAMTFTVTGDHLLVGGADRMTHTWKIDTQSESALPIHHDGKVTCVVVSPDGTRAASGGHDGVLHVWRLDRPDRRERTIPHASPITHLAAADDGRIACATEAGIVKVWNLRSDVVPDKWFAHSNCRNISLTPDGELCAVSSGLTAKSTHSANVCYIPTMLTGNPPTVPSKITDLCIDDHGKYLAIGTEGRTRCWRVDASGEVTFSGGTPGVPVGFSSEGNQLACLNEQGALDVWTSGQTFHHSSTVVDGLHQNGFAFDHQRFRALGFLSDGGVAQIWDCKANQLIAQTETDALLPRFVSASALSPSGDYAVFGDVSGKVYLWDVASEHFGWADEHHTKRVATVRFSTDGQSFVTASEDHTAMIWSTGARQPVVPQLEHADEVNDAVFSKNNLFVATAAGSSRQDAWGAARIWDAQTGQRVSPLLPHWDDVYRVLFSPNDEGLWTTSWDGYVRCWHAAETTTLAPDTLSERVQLLSARRMEDSGSQIPLRNRETLDLWARSNSPTVPKEGEDPIDFIRWYDRHAHLLTKANQWSTTAQLYAQLARELPNITTMDVGPADSIPDDLVTHLDSAQGMFVGTTAFCQRLPWDDVNTTFERLGRFGYRPIRIRPYQINNSHWVACLWKHDSTPWHLVVAQSADELEQKLVEEQASGFSPTDIAGWTIGEAPSYHSVTAQIHPDASALAKFAVGVNDTVGDSEFSKLSDRYADEGFALICRQRFVDPDNDTLSCGIFAKTAGTHRFASWCSGKRRYSDLSERLLHSQTDCDVMQAERQRNGNSFTVNECSGCFHAGLTQRSFSLQSVEIGSHTKIAATLLKKGYGMVALSVGQAEFRDDVIAYSVWVVPELEVDLRAVE